MLKISELPPVNDFKTTEDYVEYREKRPELGRQYGVMDMFQLIRVLQNQNNELANRVKRLENLLNPID